MKNLFLFLLMPSLGIAHTGGMGPMSEVVAKLNCLGLNSKVKLKKLTIATPTQNCFQ